MPHVKRKGPKSIPSQVQLPGGIVLKGLPFKIVEFNEDGTARLFDAFDPQEHHEAWIRLGRPRGPAAAMRVVREAWGDDPAARDVWLEQQDVGEMVEDGLDPRRAYAAWRDAWQDCAASAVKRAIEDYWAPEG